MAQYPGAIQRPVTASKGRKRLTVYNRVNLHVAVSEASSLHGYFNKSGRPDSHFYVRKDGSVEQYVDTTMRAFADLEGNDATISIETQGGVNGSDTEKWTSAQVETLARIFAWAVRTHGVRNQLASSSKLDASSKGLSWHRLGIDGTFPVLPSILAGRLQRGGGMRYSTSRGKNCPGNAKIQQIPGIYQRVQQVLGAPVPPPKPVRIDEDGWLGPASIGRWQQIMGTPVDRAISTPDSQLVRRVQEALNRAGCRGYNGRALKVDGAGIYSNVNGKTPKTHTIYALQRYLGTVPDGVFDAPSTAVVVLQRRLNTGRF